MGKLIKFRMFGFGRAQKVARSLGLFLVSCVVDALVRLGISFIQSDKYEE